ncbi:hypothetical protein HAX54_050308, partial [Datura stramonium]|nr:hypothetical protein [Datura stramonium]
MSAVAVLACSTHELQLLTVVILSFISPSTMERALLDLGAASGICVMTDQFDYLRSAQNLKKITVTYVWIFPLINRLTKAFTMIHIRVIPFRKREVATFVSMSVVVAK